MFAISNEGILIINEVESDLLELIPVFQFVMTLSDENIQENNAFKQYLANKNKKVLQWDDSMFRTYVGFHKLEKVQAMFHQVSDVERARRKAQRKYECNVKFERLKFWKKWR